MPNDYSCGRYILHRGVARNFFLTGMNVGGGPK